MPWQRLLFRLFIVLGLALGATAKACPDLSYDELVALGAKDKKKIVFFASWCSSCKEHLKAQASPDAIFLATFDSPQRAAEAFASLAELKNYSCYFDRDSKIARRLKVSTLPTSKSLSDIAP